MILTLSLLHLLDGVDKTEFFGDSADDEIAVGYLLREGICAAGVGCEGHVEEEVQGHQAEHRRQQTEIHRPRETVFINKPLKSSAVAKNLLLVLPGHSLKLTKLITTLLLHRIHLLLRILLNHLDNIILQS